MSCKKKRETQWTQSIFHIFWDATDFIYILYLCSLKSSFGVWENMVTIALRVSLYLIIVKILPVPLGTAQKSLFYFAKAKRLGLCRES
jgi:hypothetical protein